jgi:LDH2 family malate/lactate/ureidoglycolate dehydrogenase
MTERYQPSDLTAFAERLLAGAGLPTEPAAAVAAGLVEADLLGHTTHGLALLGPYLGALEAGTMERDGRPAVLTEAPAAAVWDGRRLPGVWTTGLAVEAATAKAATQGVGAIVVRRSHHIACLAAFLEKPARDGFAVIVLSSDPAVATVAPHGGITPVMTPNPLAVALPASAGPILIDVSTSITTNGLVARTAREGGRMAGPWLVDAEGRASDDPAVASAGGALLPVGGLDHGHKGFALSLMVEALTQGLGGYGRAEAPTEWGAAVTVVAFAPALFAGIEPFLAEVDWLAGACRAARPRDPATPVRMPGEAALARKAKALREGVALHPEVAAQMAALAERHGIAGPRVVGG